MTRVTIAPKLAQSPPTPTRASEFRAGFKATFPLMIGAIPFAIIFGALAVTSGLSVWAAAGMSLFVFAGSAQFIGVTMFASGAALPIIVLTTFVVNLRHALYSATLAPFMKHLPQSWLLPLGFTLTDETFVVVAEHYQNDKPSQFKHWYHFGSALPMYVNWNFWTVVGIIAGSTIPDPTRFGLDFALSVTFIGMVVPMMKNRPVVGSVVVAGVVSVLLAGMPNRIGLLIAAIFGVIVGVVLESLSPKAEFPAADTQTKDGMPS